jgi:predicted kinase
VIIWLNGAFGAGKSTVAGALLTRLPAAQFADPETLGRVLQRITRAPAYQDLALWRRLVRWVLRLRHAMGNRVHPNVVVVPMTLLRPEYRVEILGGLRRARLRVVQVVLTVPEPELRARIEADAIDPTAAPWRLAHVEAAAGLVGLAQREPDTIEVSNVGRTPDAVAAEIITRYGLG